MNIQFKIYNNKKLEFKIDFHIEKIPFDKRKKNKYWYF